MMHGARIHNLFSVQHNLRIASTRNQSDLIGHFVVRDFRVRHLYAETSKKNGRWGVSFAVSHCMLASRWNEVGHLEHSRTIKI